MNASNKNNDYQIISGILASLFIAGVSIIPSYIIGLFCALTLCVFSSTGVSFLTAAQFLPLIIFIVFSLGINYSFKDKKPIFSKTLFITSCLIAALYALYLLPVLLGYQ